MKTLRLTIALVILPAFRPANAATPPSGFQDTTIMTATMPTAMAYEPGSKNLFILEKGGSGTARVRRRAFAGGTVTTALTLTNVDTDGERGLLGIAFDPDYLQSASTRIVYLYVTKLVTGGSHNQVWRYKESGGTLTADGTTPILDGPTLTSATNHNAGTLRFGNDKTLYISMGDNDTDADPLPKARDLTDLRGKILRINRDGTIPPDNPYAFDPGKRHEIWAWGLRNPFRFTIDSATGIPWIADVGENTWEEIDKGISGADYGWPCYEGDATFVSCSAPNAVFPVLEYGHDGVPSDFHGNCVIGGPVYRGGSFPASYEGRLFFADYGAGWMRSALVGANGTLSDVQLFFDDANSIVDVAQSPNGCLGWVDISGSIHESCYTAGTNTAPVALASASPLTGSTPLTVQFTGSASTDADGDTLRYAWTFGDGGTSTSADPQHTYTAPGSYTATLTVNDQRGAANSSAVAAPLTILAGAHAPVPSIAGPANGSHYDAGDVISYSGSATDVEDGTIPASGLSWTIVFHHEDHTHPFLGPLGGSSGTFTIPTSGEDSTHVWFRISLTATDSGAPIGVPASASTYVDVLPNVATITLAAQPAALGLSLSYSGTQAPAPVSFDSVVHFPRNIAAPSPQIAGGRTWTFMHWNDVVTNARTIATPSADTTYTAYFRCTAGCAGLPDQDGDGFTVEAGDCDDTDPTVFPGAPELCDGKDNDCNGTVDDATCSAFAGPGGTMNGIDLALLSRYFGSCSQTAGSQPWAAADLTKDGCLDGSDLAVMAAVWGCHDSVPICH